MFGLGFIEIGIILILGYLAFKNFIVRRYPNFHRTIRFVFIGTALVTIVFGLITRYA